MKKEKVTYTSTGIGFCGALQVLLIGLKLCNVIDWSWWFVLLPTMVDVVVTVAVILIAIFVIEKE